MCRKLALAATILMTPLLLAAPQAYAFGFGKPAAQPTVASGASASAPSAVPPMARPNADERAAADRMEPLGRAAYWASQVSADPKDVEAGLKLAGALRALGRYQEAFEAAGQVLVLQPNNIDALLEQARVAISDSQGFYAVAPARKAQALAPKDWRPATLLAVGLEQAERPAEAGLAHAQALALGPDSPTVLSNAAMFYAAQGDLTKAEALLRKAVLERDAGIQVRQNLSLVLGLEGKLDEAEALQRQDLPPQMVAHNLAYLRAASAK